MVGVSRNTISSIETGQFNPTAKLALVLCIALDKKFEELFYFQERSEFQFICEQNVYYIFLIASEQDKLQKILPLPELMILRYLTDNKRIILLKVQGLTQLPIAEARKSCNNLVKDGLIGLSGKEYMLTAKVYDAIKSDVEYTQDTTFDM